MKENKSNSTNDEIVMKFILDECVNDLSIRKKYFPEYSRKENIDNIDYKHLEDIFSNKEHYIVMKELPLSEKFAIYVCTFRSEYLDRLCKDYQISKKGFVKLKENGVKHFRRNYKKYNKRNNYYKKGCGFNG